MSPIIASSGMKLIDCWRESFSSTNSSEETAVSTTTTGSAKLTIGSDTDDWGSTDNYIGIMFIAYEVSEAGSKEVNYDHIMEQSKGIVDIRQVLLDNQLSTVNVFYERWFLKSVQGKLKAGDIFH